MENHRPTVPKLPAPKEKTFPSKLHQMLSNPTFRDMITWLPHGRSWQVLKPKQFEEKVIPLYFRHRNLGSFMRQVNGWGFRRVNHGPDRNSYYHESFLRGFPELCRQMRRPSSEELRALKSGPSIAPNFYEISKRYPLPGKNKSEPKGGDETQNPDMRLSMMELELLKRSSLSPSMNPYLLHSDALLNRMYDARSGPAGNHDILAQRAHPDILHQSHPLNGISHFQPGLITSSLLQGSLNKYQQLRAHVDVSPATTELEIIQEKMNAIQQRISLLSQPLSSILNSSIPSQFLDPTALDTLGPNLNLMDQGMKHFHPSKF